MTLGLPDTVEACLFDLDGVLTRTRTVHVDAWTEVFNAFLAGVGQRPFTEDDYNKYVDGRRREDGVQTFLTSRGLALPEGSDDDPRDAMTVHALATRKNEQVLAAIREGRVHAYEGSARYIRACAEAGLRRAVVSASANTSDVLRSTGLDALVEVQVDGLVAKREDLPGKPAPDTFLRAADEFGLSPDRCAVFEDALAGVAAGRAGRFGFVVGVDRADQAAGLKEAGADVVVPDLEVLL